MMRVTFEMTRLQIDGPSTADCPVEVTQVNVAGQDQEAGPQGVGPDRPQGVGPDRPQGEGPDRPHGEIAIQVHLRAVMRAGIVSGSIAHVDHDPAVIPANAATTRAANTEPVNIAKLHPKLFLSPQKIVIDK